MTSNQPQPHPGAALDLPDALAQIAMAEAIAAALRNRSSDLRTQVGEQIARKYDETGEKVAVDVRLPGTRTVVGKVSTSITQEATVVSDMDALVEWALRAMPQEVETKLVLRSSTVTALLKNVEWGVNPDDPDGDEVALRINAEGEPEVVPGLSRKPGGEFSSFSIRSRDDKALLDYLATIGLDGMLEKVDKTLEAAATTVTGEVVAGEVVDAEDGEDAA